MARTSTSPRSLSATFGALARVLRVHASLGSKILSGDRALTVGHIRRLAERFRVSPALFFA